MALSKNEIVQKNETKPSRRSLRRLVPSRVKEEQDAKGNAIHHVGPPYHLTERPGRTASKDRDEGARYRAFVSEDLKPDIKGSIGRLLNNEATGCSERDAPEKDKNRANSSRPLTASAVPGPVRARAARDRRLENTGGTPVIGDDLKSEEKEHWEEGEVDTKAFVSAAVHAKRTSPESAGRAPKTARKHRKPASDAAWREGSLAKVWDTKKMNVMEELAQ